MEFYIAQGVSILTTLVAIFMMQCKNMKLILAGHIAANFLTALTYLLLGGFSGASICILAVAQSIVMFFYNRKEKKPHLPVVIGFIILYACCSALNYTSPFDIISAAAAVCFCMSVTTSTAAASRRWYVFNPLCWMIYDLFTLAYGNFIMHLIVFISTFSAMIRVDGVFCKKVR